MRVIIKEPGKPAAWRDIDNTLPALQNAVGGRIETVTVTTDAVLVLDAESRIKRKEHNMTFCGIDICGTFLIVGAKGERFRDCPLAAMKAFFGGKA